MSDRPDMSTGLVFDALDVDLVVKVLKHTAFSASLSLLWSAHAYNLLRPFFHISYSYTLRLSRLQVNRPSRCCTCRLVITHLCLLYEHSFVML